MEKLRLAFQEAGLYVGNNKVYFTTKIRRLEQRDRLKVARNPLTGQRIFTDEQIEEIVAAFLPGGNGCWYYKKPVPTKEEKRLIKLRDSHGKPGIADIEIKG
jgi:hypothetical protein